MKVLVVGSGGREHALVWKIFQSERVEKIYAAPGNDGMLELAERVDIASDDIQGLADWAEKKQIDLTVVGPEKPLVDGIVDEFQSRGLKIFGPNRAAARIEGSKVYAKSILNKYKIPTAEYEVFMDHDEALKYLKEAKYPLVIKAEGLAAGKGVFIATDRRKAEESLDKIMAERIFGDAGNRIVIEDFLEGREVSFLAFTDGRKILPLASAQDYKAVFDGDEGPNTGGMGAYSPAVFITKEEKERILTEILKPVLKAFQNEKIDYRGILYIGLILTHSGPKVVDFNTRFGDPESQVILPRLRNDLIDLIEMVIEQRLDDKVKLEWDKSAAVCIVLTSAGYPLHYKVGYKIKGLRELKKMDNALVFHANSKKVGEDFLTDGGRVLGITILEDRLFAAINQAYECVEEVYFEDMHYRTDIGHDLFDRDY